LQGAMKQTEWEPYNILRCCLPFLQGSVGAATVGRQYFGPLAAHVWKMKISIFLSQHFD